MAAKPRIILSILAILTVYGIAHTTHAHHSTLPLPVTDDLWDVSQGTVVTTHSALHTSQAVDARDALGGTFGSLSFEDNNIVFSDLLPKDTVHYVEWQTTQPITLEKFRLFAWHNTSRPLNSSCTFPDARVRGFKLFRLFAKSESGQWEQIYELNPLVNGHYHIANEQYQGILQFDRPTSTDPILHEAEITPIHAQEFRAEFFQGGDPDDTTQCTRWRNATGPRVVELDGFGSTEVPEPDEPEPIVLVPGMVVSQNKKLLYEDKPGGEWKFAFGYKLPYRGLIQKLEEAGLKEGEKLFIAHYDWRNPISDAAANYLKPIIDQAKQATGADKVDIIAHSMGGLVSRAYIQGDTYDNDVDQLITLGTPHKGSADAYVAWEGGQFPVGWGSLISDRIESIEKALRKTRNQPKLERPKTFRTFFPALRDLLPTEDYIKREGTIIPIAELTEQNPFLQNLTNTSTLLDDRGIEVTTIAGSEFATLSNISLINSRTDKDVAFSRWRDGQANPNPPPLDSTSGDGRVLVSSAHIGSNNLTLDNAEHHVLANETQDLILEILGFDPIPPKLIFDLPGKLLDITILSPVDAVITGPDGKILSKDRNDFGEELAEYDDDPNDPDDPKTITVLNADPGSYTVTLTGTGTGAYTVITCFADEDESVCTTREGETSSGKAELYSLKVTEESFEPPVGDVVALICQIKQSTFDLLLQKHIKVKASKLHGLATRLCSFAQNWQKQTEKKKPKQSDIKRWHQKTRADFERFSEELDTQIEQSNLDDEAVRELVRLRDEIQATYPN